MGIEPFLVSSAVDCVLAQRLARKLCDKCREPYEPTEEALAEAKWHALGGAQVQGEPRFFRPAGCAACGRTGYRGRLALHEVMTVSEEIERLCVERRSSEEIGRAAQAQGMTLLRQDGLYKVGLGITSLDEIMRVVA
jgi:type IV pilus assembly protein PilB